MKTASSNQSSFRWRESAAARQPWFFLGLTCAAGLLLFRTAVTDFESGRLVCGLVLLHFLPGTAVALLCRRRDLLETVVFGLALSPLVVTLLVYTFAYLLHLPLPAAIGVAGLVLAAILGWPLRKDDPVVTAPFEWAAAAPLGVGLLLILLTAAHYLHMPSQMLNLHGLFHSTGSNQIMAGLIPPDNPHLYGTPSGYQWPAWIASAVSSTLMEISVPLAAAYSRFLTFTGLMGLGYLLARDLGQKPAGRTFSGLLAVLGMNLFGGLLYLYRLSLSPELRQVVLTGAYHPGLRLLLTPESMASHLRPRTCSIILKLVKFSFIIPGYVAVMIAIFGVVRVFRGKKREGYLMIFLGTATALLIHPVLAVALALPMPLALGLSRLFKRREERFPLVPLFGVALCLGLAALWALPCLLPGIEAAGGGNVTARVDSGITLALVWLYFPLGLAAAPAAFRAFRERDRQNIFIVLLAVTNALFILVQRVKCDWYHLYLISIPLGLLAGGQLGHWFHRLSGKAWRAAFATALGLLVLLGPCLSFNVYHGTRRPDVDRYCFTGSPTITLQARDKDLARAYAWIRQETAPKAVLVEKPKKRNYEELSALTGRRIYTGQQTPHTPWPKGKRNPLEDALELVAQLLEPGSDKNKALGQLAGLPDPVYLFLTRQDTGGTFPLLAGEYDTLPELVRLDLDLPTVKVYRVLPR